jgi:hypothetical protein
VLPENVSERRLAIQRSQSLIYAGPLSGRQPGLVRTEEGLVLVTRGYRLLKPVFGEWPFIKRLLTGRLGEDTIHFYVWLKLAYEHLRDGKLTPGLLLAITGDRDMHKTCVQELIVTPALGGRSTQPDQYFNQRTDFNGEFIGVEHLIIGDPPDVRNNTYFSDQIKKLCSTASHHIHPKNRPAFQAEVLWRATMTVNDSYPHINKLPDLSDPTVADKVLLLYFGGRKFGPWMPKEREEIKQRVNAELPAFIDFLVKLEVPEQLADKRFGQVAYKNKEAFDKYFAVTKQASLLDIIDDVIFSGGLHDEGWQGFARDLEMRLKLGHDEEIKHHLRSLGLEGHTFGSALHKIHDNPSTKHRIRITRRGNKSYYHIAAPAKVG